jgi:DNA-binding transcriptional regulator YdaS (Cro superfamily)
MGVAITYTYPQWIAAYPQFSQTVSQGPFETTVYPLAQTYCGNDGSGPVSDATLQAMLMGLMCAHIAQLFFGNCTSPAPQIVGRINSATEGSVSVSSEMPMPTNATQAWLYQTQFGAAFWAATSPYRRMIYRAPMPRNFNPRFGG